MKLLILQLSDLHLRTGTDNPILARDRKVVEAIQNVDYHIDACFIAISGDIAYSGASDEYLEAVEFISAVQTGLHKLIKGAPPVYTFAVPGNHDCVLVPDLPGRSSLIENILRSPPATIGDDIVTECTGVQDDFFAFLDLVEQPAREGGRLSWKYSANITGTQVEVICYNTAWLSRNPEVQGSIFFPLERMITPNTDSEFVISVCHHPINWLPASGNHKGFRTKLEETSDLILTGHEHASEVRRGGQPLRERTYVEGGALQAHGDDHSEFLSIVIDTSAQLCRVHHHEWAGDRFVEVISSNSCPQPLLLRESQSVFEVTPETKATLEDLELTIRHPLAGELGMSDIFVYPDLQEGTHDGSGVPRTILGEQLVQEVRNRKRIIITGAEKSGKSALAKRLFLDLKDDGLVPLLIDVPQSRVRSDHINDDLSALCKMQYGPHSVEAYKQLNRSSRVILVDGLERLKGGTATAKEVLGKLCDAAEHVVLFSNDLNHVIAEATGGGPDGTGTAQFDLLRLEQFGHLRRHKLAEKWLMLDPMIKEDPALLARRLLEAKRTADLTIGKNFVPSFPVFLLALLLAAEQNQQNDLTASTYGYFYEILIKKSLVEGRSSHSDVDIRMAYLTFFAGDLFTHKKEDVSDKEFREIHKGYEDEYFMDLPFASLQEDLVKRGILYSISGRFGFRYKYIYYYFVAKFLAKSIEEEETQAIVSRLCENLANEEDANVLLFLAHLSKHPSIINGMLRQANEIFSEFQPASLSGNLGYAAELSRVYEALEHQDRSALEGQRDAMREMDMRDQNLKSGDGSPRDLAVAVAEGADISEYQEQMDAVDEVVRRFAAATKTLQILGQTVKNFPGTMNGPTKVQVTGAAYNLGLKTLAALHEYVLAQSEVIVEIVRENQMGESDSISREEVLLEAREIVYSLLHASSFGMIRRIVLAVGSRDLNLVFEHLRENETKTPGRELIHTALTLEQTDSSLPMKTIKEVADQVEKSHAHAYEVLRHLVHHHMQLFEINLKEKQQACALLGIKFTSLRKVNPAKKLLKKG